MADYYLQFSCVLDVGTAENAVAAIAIASGAAVRIDPDDNEDGDGDGDESDECRDGGFMVEAGATSAAGSLWIHSGDYGDPDRVVAFVLRCAEAFNLSGLWGFCWATTCSRLRIDEFGGGVCLLDLATRQEVASINCTDWLTDKMKQEPEISEPPLRADEQRAGTTVPIPAAEGIPLCRLFRASSGHLTPATWTWLDAQFADGGSREPGERTPTDLPGGRTQEGWFLYALEDADDTIPADLAEVFAAARSLSADYVLLEPEGPVSSALPVLHPDFREELSDTTAPER
jgi:hypothetical protein